MKQLIAVLLTSFTFNMSVKVTCSSYQYVTKRYYPGKSFQYFGKNIIFFQRTEGYLFSIG
jgi:hypothetical protein